MSSPPQNGMRSKILTSQSPSQVSHRKLYAGVGIGRHDSLKLDRWTVARITEAESRPWNDAASLPRDSASDGIIRAVSL